MNYNRRHLFPDIDIKIISVALSQYTVLMLYILGRCSMIHYYFGDGKGKTSAAAGACIRALGNGIKCAAVQFHKNGTSGEMLVLKNSGADVFACRGKVGFFKNMTEEEIEMITRDHNENLGKVICGDYGLIVLDELGDSVDKKTSDIGLVSEILEKKDCEIIITGHKPIELFMSCADYITEFRCIAHPYKNGVKARKGVEY